MAFFQFREEGAEDFNGEQHQTGIQRHRQQKNAQQFQAVDAHQHHATDDLRRRQHPADPMLDEKQPHLPRPVQPPLDVSGAPAFKVGHGQRQHVPHQKIQHARVQMQRDKT